MCKKITILILFLGIGLITGCSEKSQEKINQFNISVAASLVEPMNEIIALFEETYQIHINMNSGGSGTLKKQISEGAPIALFFSANEKYIDELISDGVIAQQDKRNPITNSLVLIANEHVDQTVDSPEQLKDVNSLIAIGEPSTVPAGEYAKEALINIGAYETLEPKLITAKDVTAVKTYVEREDVSYGFVYKSDTLTLKNSLIVFEIPTEYYKDIVYSVGIIKECDAYEEAELLLELVNSNEGKKIFESYGFKIEE